MARDYKKIVAWQRTHELTLRVYRETRRFPDEERFGITSQLRRAASSSAANIVEGSGRDSKKDYLRFLCISYSSLKETEYFLLLAKDLELLNPAVHDEMTEQINRTFASLHGLIQSVKKETGRLNSFIALLLSSIIITSTRLTLKV